jgi:multidrug efflux pump subunit AcrA (membrane-fusion protein)
MTAEVVATAAPTPQKRAKPFVVDVRGTVIKGLLLIGIGFGGFLIWASLAPLTSAVVAPGMVVADSRNKAIQHLEGGLIEQVLVREGDTVAAGARSSRD